MTEVWQTLTEVWQTLTANPEATTIGALILAVLVLRALAGSRRSRRRRTARRLHPRGGEVWFALVPFADGTGSKDRPVLVLSVGPSTCRVARLTSQDKSGRSDFVKAPEGVPGLRKDSWLDLRPIELPTSALRRRSGEPGEHLVGWYLEQAR